MKDESSDWQKRTRRFILGISSKKTRTCPAAAVDPGFVFVASPEPVPCSSSCTETSPPSIENPLPKSAPGSNNCSLRPAPEVAVAAEPTKRRPGNVPRSQVRPHSFCYMPSGRKFLAISGSKQQPVSVIEQEKGELMKSNSVKQKLVPSALADQFMLPKALKEQLQLRNQGSSHPCNNGLSTEQDIPWRPSVVPHRNGTGSESESRTTRTRSGSTECLEQISSASCASSSIRFHATQRSKQHNRRSFIETFFRAFPGLSSSSQSHGADVGHSSCTSNTCSISAVSDVKSSHGEQQNTAVTTSHFVPSAAAANEISNKTSMSDQSSNTNEQCHLPTIQSPSYSSPGAIVASGASFNKQQQRRRLSWHESATASTKLITNDNASILSDAQLRQHKHHTQMQSQHKLVNSMHSNNNDENAAGTVNDSCQAGGVAFDLVDGNQKKRKNASRDSGIFHDLSPNEAVSLCSSYEQLDSPSSATTPHKPLIRGISGQIFHARALSRDGSNSSSSNSSNSSSSNWNANNSWLGTSSGYSCNHDASSVGLAPTPMRANYYMQQTEASVQDANSLRPDMGSTNHLGEANPEAVADTTTGASSGAVEYDSETMKRAVKKNREVCRQIYSNFRNTNVKAPVAAMPLSKQASSIESLLNQAIFEMQVSLGQVYNSASRESTTASVDLDYSPRCIPAKCSTNTSSSSVGSVVSSASRREISSPSSTQLLCKVGCNSPGNTGRSRDQSFSQQQLFNFSEKSSSDSPASTISSYNRPRERSSNILLLEESGAILDLNNQRHNLQHMHHQTQDSFTTDGNSCGFGSLLSSNSNNSNIVEATIEVASPQMQQQTTANNRCTYGYDPLASSCSSNYAEAMQNPSLNFTEAFDESSVMFEYPEKPSRTETGQNQQQTLVNAVSRTKDDFTTAVGYHPSLGTAKQEFALPVYAIPERTDNPLLAVAVEQDFTPSLDYNYSRNRIEFPLSESNRALYTISAPSSHTKSVPESENMPLFKSHNHWKLPRFGSTSCIQQAVNNDSCSPMMTTSMIGHFETFDQSRDVDASSSLSNQIARVPSASNNNGFHSSNSNIWPTNRDTQGVSKPLPPRPPPKVVHVHPWFQQAPAPPTTAIPAPSNGMKPATSHPAINTFAAKPGSAACPKALPPPLPPKPDSMLRTQAPAKPEKPKKPPRMNLAQKMAVDNTEPPKSLENGFCHLQATTTNGTSATDEHQFINGSVETTFEVFRSTSSLSNQISSPPSRDLNISDSYDSADNGAQKWNSACDGNGISALTPTEKEDRCFVGDIQTKETHSSAVETPVVTRRQQLEKRRSVDVRCEILSAYLAENSSDADLQQLFASARTSAVDCLKNFIAENEQHAKKSESNDDSTVHRVICNGTRSPETAANLHPLAKTRHAPTTAVQPINGDDGYAIPAKVDRNDLETKKAELMESLGKKLKILEEEMDAIREEIQMNEKLGDTIANYIECSSLSTVQQKEQYQRHVTELDNIICLLLKLSGQLASIENCLKSTSLPVHEKQAFQNKKKRLQSQMLEAKRLKESVDQRSDEITQMLRSLLPEEHFQDYRYFVAQKQLLRNDLQEIQDKINLGQEQKRALESSTIR